MTTDYEFISGVESIPVPTAGGDPTTTADLISQLYADKSYARGIADVATLKAIGSSGRTNNLPIFVNSLNSWFYFDSGSSATGNDITIIQPTSGSGRWIRIGDGILAFAIGNNQSAQSVTSLIFDKTKIRSAEIHYQVYRAATASKAQKGILLAIYDGNNWEIDSMGQAGDAGVDFNIDTSTGQVTYTSDNMAGSYDSTNSVMKYYATQMEI